MTDPELKQLWQHQKLSAPPPVPGPDLVREMERRMRKFDRTIFWRDARELGACGVLMLWFGLALFRQTTALTRAGNGIIVASCVVIATGILSARRAQRSFLNPRPVRDFLRGERAKVSRQIRLLRTVLWWYILPLFCGAALSVLGEPVGAWGKALAVAALVPVGWFVHWLNQQAVRRSLMPLQSELDSTLNATPEFLEPENHNSSSATL
jgi:hypothetical protein